MKLRVNRIGAKLELTDNNDKIVLVVPLSTIKSTKAAEELAESYNSLLTSNIQLGMMLDKRERESKKMLVQLGNATQTVGLILKTSGIQVEDKDEYFAIIPDSVSAQTDMRQYKIEIERDEKESATIFTLKKQEGGINGHNTPDTKS